MGDGLYFYWDFLGSIIFIEFVDFIKSITNDLWSALQFGAVIFNFIIFLFVLLFAKHIRKIDDKNRLMN